MRTDAAATAEPASWARIALKTSASAIRAPVSKRTSAATDAMLLMKICRATTKTLKRPRHGARPANAVTASRAIVVMDAPLRSTTSTISTMIVLRKSVISTTHWPSATSPPLGSQNAALAMTRSVRPFNGETIAVWPSPRGVAALPWPTGACSPLLRLIRVNSSHCHAKRGCAHLPQEISVRDRLKDSLETVIGWIAYYQMYARNVLTEVNRTIMAYESDVRIGERS